jgi:hypothetical protein
MSPDCDDWWAHENQPKMFALIFETGDEIASVLLQFSKDIALRRENPRGMRTR